MSIINWLPCSGLKKSENQAENQESTWNGHQIAISLGRLLILAGSITTLVGSIALFRGITTIGSLTPHVIILGGLSAVIIGVVMTIIMNRCSQSDLTDPNKKTPPKDKKILNEEILTDDQKHVNNSTSFDVDFDTNYEETLNDIFIDIEDDLKLDQTTDVIKGMYETLLTHCPVSYRKELISKMKIDRQPEKSTSNSLHDLADLTKTPEPLYLDCALVRKLQKELIEKDAAGFTPIGIAWKTNNMDFIDLITDPTSGIDWNAKHFESVLQDFFIAVESCVEKKGLEELESQRFEKIITKIANCNPSLVDSIIMPKNEKRLTRTTSLWDEKELIEDKDELISQRKEQIRKTAIALKFYKEDGLTVWEKINEKDSSD